MKKRTNNRKQIRISDEETITTEEHGIAIEILSLGALYTLLGPADADTRLAVQETSVNSCARMRGSTFH